MKKSLLRQTFLLMCASLFARFLGMLYQTILSRTIGPQGLGLYQMTFTVYSACLTLATIGMTQSLSKTTSEFMAKGDFKNAQKNFRLTITLVFVTSLFIALFVLIFAPNIAMILYDDARLILPLRFISISIFFVALSQVFQGYFQGQKNMLPTATSQITEQIFRLLSIPLIIVPLLKRGTVAAASGTVLGMGIAELFGFLVLFSFYLFSSKKIKKQGSYQEEKAAHQLLKNLFMLAIPIGLGSLVATTNYSLGNLIIPRALRLAGYTQELAVESLGYFSGMALPLIFFPTVFSFPIAVSLLPGISEAIEQKNHSLARIRIKMASKFTILLGFSVALVLSLYNYQIPYIIFGYKEAGSYLTVLAISCIFIYPHHIFTSVLHGLGRPTLALRNLIILTVLNLSLLLLSVSRIGIMGAVWTFALVNTFSFFLDYFTIKSVFYFKFEILNWFIKPLICALFSYKVSDVFLPTESFQLTQLLVNLIITSGLFGATLLFTRTIKLKEIKPLFQILNFRK
ncbi:polysaccharide biosynthesis protein [Proteinivorax hydrogeniformans]|uniref:Polysaccharide biosynthesis protein n=1 Tax=Proteinivorax hydrogeniformans TaxID=1826727 RepID=A0AAU8HPU9_9FIRM